MRDGELTEPAGPTGTVKPMAEQLRGAAAEPGLARTLHRAIGLGVDSLTAVATARSSVAVDDDRRARLGAAHTLIDVALAELRHIRDGEPPPDG